jgi:hypothetical protein
MLIAVALTTFCWAADLGSERTCVYSAESCREIMTLRGGICAPSSDTRFWRNRQSSNRTSGRALWSSGP